jgi:AmmeMemoRadiSam system protein A
MKEFSITEKNQKELLRIARTAVADYLAAGKLPTFTTSDAELNQDAAVFVTLTEHGDLRGCIGTTVPQEPLHRAVARMAIAAATEDTRFHPVSADELKDIRFEISVLSPMVPVSCADEIKQGRDGVMVRRGRRCGLFLPQVWEHFKTKEDFLCELCWQKVGIEPTAWQDPDTDLSIFTVFAFEEKP